MPTNRYTELAEGISRSSVRPLDFIDNRTILIETIEQTTGLPVEVLILAFLGCAAVFLIIAVLKFKPKTSDI